jgi:hypothetical protein
LLVGGDGGRGFDRSRSILVRRVIYIGRSFVSVGCGTSARDFFTKALRLSLIVDYAGAMARRMGGIDES